MAFALLLMAGASTASPTSSPALLPSTPAINHNAPDGPVNVPANAPPGLNGLTAAPTAPGTAPDMNSPATNSPPITPWTPPEVMPAHARWTWETSDGKTYQNVVVTQITADTVTISHDSGVAHVPIANLPPEIQKQLNYDSNAASQIYYMLNDKLISSDGTPTSVSGTSVQFYALYYSGGWCESIHPLTPHLEEWYAKFKPAHPNFELIYVSEDRDEATMLAYIKAAKMPWPCVRFDALKHDGNGTFQGSGIEQYAGIAAPDLVLVDAGGKVLSDSFRHGIFAGIGEVIDDIERLVPP